MKLIKLIFTFVIILGSTFLHAATLPDLLNGVRSMKADFTQTVYGSQGKVMQVSQGSMAIARPGRFRWQVRKPLSQLIVVNQNKMWVYDPDLQQVSIRSVNQTAGETPALFLSQDNTDINQLFSVRTLPAKGRWQWYELTAKTPGNLFNQTQLGFENGKIKEMRFWDNLGHMTRIRYYNARFNIPVSNALFHFSIPSHVDVIQEG